MASDEGPVTVTGRLLLPGPDANGESVDLDGLTFPEGRMVPVLLDFDPCRAVGWAEIVRDAEGFTATARVAAVPPGACFALGGVVRARDGSTVTACQVTRVGLVQRNTDPRIGPVQRAEEP